MGQQPAFVVVDQFLRRQPSHALDEAAFDLADVDGGIDRSADVMKDIDPPDFHLAGEDVDGDFAAAAP